MDIFKLHKGTAPLLVSVPHDGTAVPDDIAARLTDAAREVPDTDWHIARLYDFAREMGASMIVPVYSRYVVDLNRSEDDVSLYPGQNTTGLCPVRRFDGGPVYLPGQEPTPDEIAARVETWWRPYHDALAGELQRLHAAHGRAVLWEAHSIRGTLPWLFDGRLPDLAIVDIGLGDEPEGGADKRCQHQRHRHRHLHHVAAAVPLPTLGADSRLVLRSQRAHHRGAVRSAGHQGDGHLLELHRPAVDPHPGDRHPPDCAVPRAVAG